MKLNKIIYAISALVLLLSSCAGYDELTTGTFSAKGEKATYEFCVDYGDVNMGTRALTEYAQIQNLYVAVFDGSGYKLSEYVKAELIAPIAGFNDTKYKYSVELTVSKNKRILHFIANGPESISYGSEAEVIGSLYTSLDNDDVTAFQDSYWQRVEMDKIPAKPLTGEDATDYNAAAAKLDNLKLIRNYSKITLTKLSTVTNFEIDGMWPINQPDRGTVAPYNRNTGTFVTDYLSYDNVPDLEGKGSGQGNYQGFMLSTTNFVYPNNASYFVESGVGQNMIAASSNIAVGYIYEREKALEAPMYLIVKGRFEGDPCYYKIALQDDSGNFYAMLRNFNYLVSIAGVARKGAATAYEALQSAPSGDISLNVEFQEIKTISDGDANISVSGTNYVLVGEIGETINLSDIWYKYEPVVDGANVVANDEYPTSNPGVEIDYLSTVGVSGAVIKTFDKADSDAGGLRYLNIETEPISSIRKTQSIIFTGKYLDGGKIKTISRRIDLTLRERLDMDLSVSPNTDASGNGKVNGNSMGQKVKLSIGVEPNLPSSMFPMDFLIEAAERTLTPDGDVLPVQTGASTIQDNTTTYYGKPSYWFIKTVTWEEYSAAALKDGKKYFYANFKTNVAVSATDIYVSQSYFNQEKVNLSNFAAKTFSTPVFSASSINSGEQTTVTFNMSGTVDGGKVYVSMTNIEPTSASGLTYVRTDVINGVEYEVYQMTVGSATSGSFTATGYSKGNAYIFLSAPYFEDSNMAKAKVDGGDTLALYYDAAKATSAIDFVQLPYTYTGAYGYPVVGQTVTQLTVYVEDNGETHTVTIGGNNATEGSGSYTHSDGKTYIPYYITNLAAGTTCQTRHLTVTCDGEDLGTADLKVYGLTLRTDQEVTSKSSLSSSKYYVVQNFYNERRLRNTNAEDTFEIPKDFDYLYLWSLDPSGTTSRIRSTGTSNLWYLRLNNNRNTLRFRTNTGDYPQWNMTYNSGKGGFTFEQNSYYLYNNNGNLGISNGTINNNRQYWHVYPVDIVEP